MGAVLGGGGGLRRKITASLGGQACREIRGLRNFNLRSAYCS